MTRRPAWNGYTNDERYRPGRDTVERGWEHTLTPSPSRTGRTRTRLNVELTAIITQTYTAKCERARARQCVRQQTHTHTQTHRLAGMSSGRYKIFHRRLYCVAYVPSWTLERSLQWKATEDICFIVFLRFILSAYNGQDSCAPRSFIKYTFT